MMILRSVQGWRFLLAMLGGGLVVILMMGMAAKAPRAQSSLELFQDRVGALEEGLKDIRRILEEDLRQLKDSLGSAGGESGEALDDLVADLVEQVNALNSRLERSLAVASDNEFRLQRLESRLESLIQISFEDDVPPSLEADEFGPGGNTGTGDLPSSVLNSSRNEDSTWTISADRLNEELSNLPQNADDENAAENAIATTTTLASKVLPDEQYNSALQKALQNDLVGAESALAEFIEGNPGHDRLSDATFWLGRVQFMQSSYEEAAKTFAEFNTSWPTDSRREKTMLLIGESVTHFAQPSEVCDLLSSLPNLIEDPTEEFFERLGSLKQQSECSS